MPAKHRWHPTGPCPERSHDSIRFSAPSSRSPARRAGSSARGRCRAARGDSLGLLHGLPVAVKDCIDVAGIRCTIGSASSPTTSPARDAAVVRRLRAAGAVLLGKTNLHEFAFGGTSQNAFYGGCRNPWDTARIPGGSSGGSAVAVAAGLAGGALGSDTGASIRMPAALCGVSGLRPTHGTVSNGRRLPGEPALRHGRADRPDVADRRAPVQPAIVEPIARRAHGRARGRARPRSARRGGLRIVVPDDFFFAESDAECRSRPRRGAGAGRPGRRLVGLDPGAAEVQST